MKKVISYVIAVIFAWQFLFLPVQAVGLAEKETNNFFSQVTIVPGIEENTLTPTPRVVTVCGNLSYHKMMSSGWGSVYLAD